METVGERLNYARKQLGLTYKEMSAIVDLKGDAIRIAITRNSVRDVYLNILCKELGINKNWLLNGVGDWIAPNSETRIRDYLKGVESKLHLSEPVVELKTKNRSLEDDLLIKLLMKSNSEQEAEILELKRRIKELEQRG